MRILQRHAIAILVFTFLFKIAMQAQESDENSGVPKSLLLGSLAPQRPIPSENIDARPVIAAIRRE